MRNILAIILAAVMICSFAGTVCSAYEVFADSSDVKLISSQGGTEGNEKPAADYERSSGTRILKVVLGIAGIVALGILLTVLILRKEPVSKGKGAEPPAEGQAV